MLHLEKIDHRNVWDVIDLKVFQKQKHFVASNGISLIQAYSVRDSETKAFPFGIYNGKRLVGFLMIGYNEAATYDAFDVEPPQVLHNNYSIWRLMIDKRYQKKGFGREAVRLALEFVRTWPHGKAEACVTSYNPENDVAKKLYASFGFTENGEMDEDEIVAVLKL